MSVVLSLLALAMIAMGGTAMVFGAQIIQVEKGWTMVIAGSVGATGGAVLLGVALATRRLGRIASQLLAFAASLDQVAALATANVGAAPPPPADLAEPMAALAAPQEPVVLEAPPGPYDTPPSASIVGRYSSGGNAYVMFADGSVQADTPSGRHRFRSLDELRAFVAGGGER